ncbi:unnamed protein product [Pieris brassicae]|uniref:Major facilitator superfamily (MFS) profile domain-containing protein n=1 Tax=Pieris brassicae TaxID=7116 RepID=A0A9P0TJD5_PIEBR|nr:unnamed protein product [Pieris brassicae]
MSKTKTITKLVPPDGGWGWIVLFGSAVTNVFNQAVFSQFSLLYGDKLKEMGHRTTGAAMVMSVMLCVVNLGGPFVGVLVKLKSPRFVCVTGSLICATGIFLSSFSTNIVHLSLSYGVVFGLGLGFIYNASFVAINSYFKLKKSIAVGIAMTGTGIGQALMPHVVEYSLDIFGFRGACWFLSALCLHGVCGGMLMQPVKWHMKKIEEEVVIEEEKIEMNKSQTDIKDDRPAIMFTKDRNNECKSQLLEKISVNGFSDDFKAVLAYQTDLTSLLVLSALYGIGRSVVIVARNLTITEHCRADQVPSAVGLGMLCLGITSPPIGYFLGWIRDYTEDYIACAGLGFIQNASFVAINSYFKLKKSIAVGIAMTGTGIGQTLMPHVVRYLLESYGFRGACLLLSAMSLHGICGTLLIQPVEWHMKKIEEEVVVDEKVHLLEESKNKTNYIQRDALLCRFEMMTANIS